MTGMTLKATHAGQCGVEVEGGRVIVAASSS